MDPFVIAALVLIAAIFIGQRLFSGPDTRTRTIELAPAVTVRLTPEQQAVKGQSRTHDYMAQETEAHRAGLTSPILYGARMQALARVPNAVKAHGESGLPGFE